MLSSRISTYSPNYPYLLDTHAVQDENVGGTRYAYSEQQEWPAVKLTYDG
jgi:hypothetical protein